MNKLGTLRFLFVLLALALVASACGGTDDAANTADTDDAAVVEETDDADAVETDDADAEETDAETDDEPAGEIATDVGVTEEACPNAVNPDNGCIYLGILSDLSIGPFAALGPVIVEGQQAFWNRVNEDGGVGGFDIDIDTYTRDNEYNPQVTSQRYSEIEPEILALAQTLGTPMTEAILPDMIADNVLGTPASWWSGWHFEDVDGGVILETGHSYCTEAIIGLDWSAENEGEITTVQAVGYPGDYGTDFASGAEAWAEANGAEFIGFVETGPNALVGNQDAAIAQIRDAGADRVMIATGPLETAEIVGNVVAGGFEGRFLGAVPTWNPALMGSPAGPALEASYTHIGTHEAYGGESEAHQAMIEVRGEGNLPTNDGYTFGWIWSYPLLAALEAAAENGDLTRAGLVSVVDGLTVSYDGALPDRTFGEAGGDDRTAVISVPNADAPLALETIEVGYSSSTADEFAYETACSGV
jgi:ABC-type branched-subunit amino acid transport system substrate-binding protein